MDDNDKILDTLHTQFAENQNHHQGIFIQFLIALFGTYGYIYTHASADIVAYQTTVQKINNF